MATEKDQGHFSNNPTELFNYQKTERNQNLIQNYIHRTLQIEQNSIRDTEFFEHFTTNFNLIVANPGMGKTILLDYLFNNCPPHFWPIKVIVHQHFEFLKNPHNINVNSITDYLIEQIENETCQKYARQLKFNGNLIILWDGLDEFPSDHLENLIEIIVTLGKNRLKQIATCRAFLKPKFEIRNLDVRYITIQSFNEEEQMQFIEQTDFNGNEKMDWMKKDRELIGIPLQLYLYVESLKYSDIDIGNVANIYEQFINSKIQMLYEKNATVTDQENFKKEKFEQYQKLAIITRFGHKFQIEKTNSDENQSLFFHETITEFLIAKYLQKNWRNPDDNLFINEIFQNWFTPHLEIIRFFFDLLLAHGHPLHFHFLNRDYSRILEEKDNWDWNDCDVGNRNLLHLICSWGQTHPDLQKNDRNEYVINKFQLESDKNYEELLQYTIDRCDILLKDRVLKMSSVQYAFKNKSVFELELMIGQNKWEENIDFEGLSKDDLIYYAVECNYHGILNKIEFSNIKFENGYGLLHLASSKGCHQNVVDYLLKKGIDVNEMDDFGYTPLDEAVKRRHYNMIAFLIENGADINKCDKKVSSTLELAACEPGNLETVKLLIQYGANVNQCDYEGQTVLHSACSYGDLEIVQILIQNGADINACDYNNWTMLHSACWNENLDIVKFLIQSGVDINKCDNEGQSILYSACSNGHLEIVKFLIQSGADINQCDNEGRNILDVAREAGNVELVRFLIVNGINNDNVA